MKRRVRRRAHKSEVSIVDRLSDLCRADGGRGLEGRHALIYGGLPREGWKSLEELGAALGIGPELIRPRLSELRRSEFGRSIEARVREGESREVLEFRRVPLPEEGDPVERPGLYRAVREDTPILPGNRSG